MRAAFQSWHGMSLNFDHESPNLALVCGEDKAKEFAKEAGVRVRGGRKKTLKSKSFPIRPIKARFPALPPPSKQPNRDTQSRRRGGEGGESLSKLEAANCASAAPTCK